MTKPSHADNYSVPAEVMTAVKNTIGYGTLAQDWSGDPAELEAIVKALVHTAIIHYGSSIERAYDAGWHYGLAAAKRALTIKEKMKS